MLSRDLGRRLDASGAWFAVRRCDWLIGRGRCLEGQMETEIPLDNCKQRGKYARELRGLTSNRAQPANPRRSLVCQHLYEDIRSSKSFQ